MPARLAEERNERPRRYVLDPVLSLPAQMDQRGADETAMRLLASHAHTGLTHCSLAGATSSRAVRHRTVEMLWYVLEGEAEVWRSIDHLERVDRVLPGDSLRVAPGVAYQLRSITPLVLLIATSPPWPGPEETMAVQGIWPAGDAR